MEHLKYNEGIDRNNKGTRINKKRCQPTISNITLARHRTCLRKEAENATAARIEEFKKNLRELGISCIIFDGRMDSTNVLVKYDKHQRNFYIIIKEENYTMCSVPGGQYLCHFTLQEITGNNKNADIVVEQII